MRKVFSKLIFLAILSICILFINSGCGWMTGGDPSCSRVKMIDLVGDKMARYGVDEKSLADRKVHPHSQAVMQLTILSDSLVQLKYRRDGKEVVEIYRVTEKSVP